MIHPQKTHKRCKVQGFQDFFRELVQTSPCSLYLDEEFYSKMSCLEHHARHSPVLFTDPHDLIHCAENLFCIVVTPTVQDELSPESWLSWLSVMVHHAK